MKKFIIAIIMILTLISTAHAIRVYKNSDDSIVVNYYNREDNMDDSTITAYIGDSYGRTSQIDVDSYETTRVAILMDLPTEEDYYPVKIVVRNDETRKVRHAWILI